MFIVTEAINLVQISDALKIKGSNCKEGAVGYLEDSEHIHGGQSLNNTNFCCLHISFLQKSLRPLSRTNRVKKMRKHQKKLEMSSQKRLIGS